MDDSTSEKGEDAPPMAIVSSEGIAAANLQLVLAGLEDEDDYAVEARLFQEAQKASELPEDTRAAALHLLAGIMSIHVREDDETNPFGPKMVMDGRRSMIPDDIAGEQSAVLAELVASLPHRNLRAKVGDVVFFNSRSHWRAAAAAMVAYCEIATGRLNDTIKRRFSEMSHSILDVIQPLNRAVVLMRLTKKRGDVPPRFA